MAIVYNKYIKNQDHTWYDSSNVIYSVCFDSESDTKPLKIVFKDGRTYLYKDVKTDDYILFKTAESNGKAVNEFITKKYKGVRISDTPKDKLDELKQEFIDDNKVTEDSFKDLAYLVAVNPKNSEVRLKLNGKTIFEGVEGKISITRLLTSMNIKFIIAEMADEITKEEDFLKDGE